MTLPLTHFAPLGKARLHHDRKQLKGLGKNKCSDLAERDNRDVHDRDEAHSVLLARNDHEQIDGRSQPNRSIYFCPDP